MQPMLVECESTFSAMQWVWSLAKEKIEGHDGDCSCKNCLKIEKGTHPQFEMFKSGGLFGIEDASYVRDRCLYNSSDGLRIFFLNIIEGISDMAANSLLKTLEESNGNLLLILLVTTKWTVPETVCSRCTISVIEGCLDSDIMDVSSKIVDMRDMTLRARMDLAKRLSSIESGEEKVSLLELSVNVRLNIGLHLTKYMMRKLRG